MTTLISAEWYKLKRSKLLSFLLLGVTAQTGFQALVSYLLQKSASETGGRGGMQGAEPFIMILLSIWISAFISFFISVEFQNGLIRNALCLGKSRTKVYLSRLLSASVAMIAIFVVYNLTLTVFIGFVNGFENVDIQSLCWDWLMNLPYYLTLASAFTMLAFLSKSPGMTVLLSVGYSIFIFITMNFLGNVDLSYLLEFLPQYYVAGYSHFNSDTTFLINGALVSTAHVVIPSVIGCAAFKKSDIK